MYISEKIGRHPNSDRIVMWTKELQNQTDLFSVENYLKQLALGMDSESLFLIHVFTANYWIWIQNMWLEALTNFCFSPRTMVLDRPEARCANNNNTGSHYGYRFPGMIWRFKAAQFTVPHWMDPVHPTSESLWIFFPLKLSTQLEL